jgi:hypothetical protein
MRGSTEKSSKYLQLADMNEKRASETKNTELKRIFLELGSEYRELAELIDDPEQWRAKLTASAIARQK